MTHHPDEWLLVKSEYTGEDFNGTVYSILSSWYGGYLNGNSYRLSTAIDKTEIVEINDERWHVVVECRSGSKYDLGLNYRAHSLALGAFYAYKKECEERGNVTMTILEKEDAIKIIEGLIKND